MSTQIYAHGENICGTSNDANGILYTKSDGTKDNVQTGLNELTSEINTLNNNLSNLPTATLSSGSTSVTIADTSIKENGLIDIYTDVYGLNPTSVVVANGSVTLTFDAQTVDVQVKVRCL